MEPSERRVGMTLGRLPPGARRDLLDLLASEPEVRADAIRQLHERPDTEDLAEVLIDLEAEPVLRLGVMEALEKDPIPARRADRLALACEAALERLAAKEAGGVDPDVFAEVGEALFWLIALADETGKRQVPLLNGLRWPRNRTAHGAIVTAPAEWHYGSEPGRLILGRAVLGTISGHVWLERGKVPRGPNDWAAPEQEEADYDAHVAGKRVLDVLREALGQAR